jgi:hypothetical protein
MENTWLYGEYFDNEESVKAIVKAVIILKDNQLLLKNKLKQL